jgi:two-component system heavy metal sensor histidine kinase CusS
MSLSRKVSESLTRSMEGQLMLLFTAGATLLLITASVTLYEAIHHYMDGRMDPLFAGIIDDTIGDLSEPDGVQDVATELAAARVGAPPYWMRILDGKLAIAVETRGMSERVPLAEFPPPPVAGTARRDYIDASGRWMSVAVRAVNAHGAPFIIQVAEDRNADREFLRELRWMLGSLVAVGMLFSTAIASIVTRRGLRPLKAMERAVADVRVPQLAVRLAERSWPRELAPLALAFDQMMDRLEESFNRLSQFSADLAHELRTPIANLRGEAEVALTRVRTADEYRRVLESSMEEYERLTEITSKLLFLARADAEETEANLREIDARTVIDGLVEFYEPWAEERGVAVQSAGNAALRADAVLLRRALANLIENALHFTPPGGRVTVEIIPAGALSAFPRIHNPTPSEEAPENCLKIVVADTGCGIAPEHMPKLFDRFYQADPSRRKGGAGLGLALVKSIMNLHGGSATITSRSGLGTEVTLRFP